MNNTPSGQSLAEFIQVGTGSDAYTDPAFGWSTDLPCAACTVVDATALLSIDGNPPKRACAFTAPRNGSADHQPCCWRSRCLPFTLPKPRRRPDRPGGFVAQVHPGCHCGLIIK